jgi:hypothetical protein
MPKLTWDQVLARTDLIGGDIESQEDGVVYRGPLSEIKVEGNSICFTSPWMARLEPGTGTWHKWHINRCSVRKSLPPQDIGDGRILIQMPLLGVCTIFPKGGSKLQASSVVGLPKASERFLSLHPDLRFDRKVAEKVLREQFFMNASLLFAKKPDGAAMKDLLECFSSDNRAEEFLWHYVVAITGEENVHQKVY